MKQKEVCPCEYDTKKFLGKNDKVDMEFKKNLMDYVDNKSQLKEFMVRPSREILKPHDFKTNVLCVNAGNTKVGQLSHVVTEEQGSQIMSFQEMEEGSYNFMMKKEEALLNTVVKDLVNIGQLLQGDVKEE